MSDTVKMRVTIVFDLEVPTDAYPDGLDPCETERTNLLADPSDYLSIVDDIAECRVELKP